MLRICLVALLAGVAAGAAEAQTYYYPAQPAPAYYSPGPSYYPSAHQVPSYPAAVYGPPNYPLGGRFPRARRALEVVADPSLLASPGSTFYTGLPPTRYPIFDAAPNVANLVSIGAIGTSSAAVTAAAFGVPPAIRVARVLIIGPPEYSHNRRETLLWIVEPTLLQIYQARQARRGVYPYYNPGY